MKYYRNGFLTLQFHTCHGVYDGSGSRGIKYTGLIIKRKKWAIDLKEKEELL